jgi:hypothetical protein
VKEDDKEGGHAMKEMFSIDGKTDEELIAEYSIEIDGRTFVPARLLDAIGERQVRAADRKPGDPGTVENPIFKKGKAYVYGKRNKLILWEDYAGPIPSSEDEYLPKGTEAFTLTVEMQPTEAQKRMVQRAKQMPVVITTDCPLIPSEQLSSFTRFRQSRPTVAK